MLDPSLSSTYPRLSSYSDGSGVRIFTEADVEQVAALWQRCFRHSHEPPSAAVKAYFVDVLLRHPWYDPSLSSLVLERQGEIVGFVGRMARPMFFGGQPIRGAVITQFMVDPDRKLGFGAIALMRVVQSSPHDLLYSDGANDQSAGVFSRMTGHTSRLWSFEWTRRLRPLQSICCQLREHPRLAGVGRMARPVAGLCDAVVSSAAPWLVHRPRSHRVCEAASVEQILPLLQQVSARMAVRPDYTNETFAWLLRTTAQAQRFGPLRSLRVMGDAGTPIGWFIYFVKPGEAAYVMQAGALPNYGRDVLAALFQDAWDQGATSVEGELDPLLMIDLSNSRCTFRCPSLGVLVHSSRPEVLNAVLAGNAFLSRLEGEWWIRLGIDRHVDW